MGKGRMHWGGPGPGGLPPGASLEVRRSVPDIYRYGGLGSTYYPFGAVYTECRIHNLPLTDAQVSQLSDLMNRVQGYGDLVYLENYSLSYGGQITATLKISEKAAARICNGEPWENVVFGTCPLKIVPRAGESF